MTPLKKSYQVHNNESFTKSVHHPKAKYNCLLRI